MLSVVILPFLKISTGTIVLGFVVPTNLGKSDDLLIIFLLNYNITSPGSKPPLAAGDFFSIPAIRAPFMLLIPNDSDNSFVIS